MLRSTYCLFLNMFAFSSCSATAAIASYGHTGKWENAINLIENLIDAEDPTAAPVSKVRSFFSKRICGACFFFSIFRHFNLETPWTASADLNLIDSVPKRSG